LRDEPPQVSDAVVLSVLFDAPNKEVLCSSALDLSGGELGGDIGRAIGGPTRTVALPFKDIFLASSIVLSGVSGGDIGNAAIVCLAFLTARSGISWWSEEGSSEGADRFLETLLGVLYSGCSIASVAEDRFRSRLVLLDFIGDSSRAGSNSLELLVLSGGKVFACFRDFGLFPGLGDGSVARYIICGGRGLGLANCMGGGGRTGLGLRLLFCFRRNLIDGGDVLLQQQRLPLARREELRGRSLSLKPQLDPDAPC